MFTQKVAEINKAGLPLLNIVIPTVGYFQLKPSTRSLTKYS